MDEENNVTKPHITFWRRTLLALLILVLIGFILMLLYQNGQTIVQRGI